MKDANQPTGIGKPWYQRELWGTAWMRGKGKQFWTFFLLLWTVICIALSAYGAFTGRYALYAKTLGVGDWLGPLMIALLVLCSFVQITLLQAWLKGKLENSAGIVFFVGIGYQGILPITNPEHPGFPMVFWLRFGLSVVMIACGLGVWFFEILRPSMIRDELIS